MSPIIYSKRTSSKMTRAKIPVDLTKNNDPPVEKKGFLDLKKNILISFLKKHFLEVCQGSKMRFFIKN